MIISKKKWEAFKKEYQKQIDELKEEIRYTKLISQQSNKLVGDVLKAVK